MRPSSEFRPQIKADKFFSPRVDSPQFLYRKRVVDYLLRQNGTRTATIVVEAQAGLGKTTTIKQYLDRIQTASVWYQVGPEDGDPGFFLQAIASCINSLLADCPSAATTKILGCGDCNVLDLPRRLDLLLHDLDACLKDDLYMVFDDLQYLLPHPTSLFILNYLLASAPPRLHFILASREPLNALEQLTRTRNLSRLDNRSLAMDEHDVADFFHQSLHLAVPLDIVRKVTRLTEGWTMGVRLLGLHMVQHHGQADFPALSHWEAKGRQELLLYFRREILAFLDEAIHRPLLILSLLDEIPLELAIELTNRSDIGNVLSDLVRRNIFSRHLDPHNGEFGLHYLFREFLQEKAEEELSRETITTTYRQAGHFCLKQGNPAQALRYFLRAEDYKQIDAVLQDTGMAFLATNQAATLNAILSRIPEPYLHQMGWASLFLALAHMDSAPTLALPLLDQALTIFTAQHNEVGELLSLTHDISIRIITTGHYRGAEVQLDRAMQLFERVADALDLSTTILVAHNLAMGHCIFLANIDEATSYASQALILAREEKLVNFEAALLMVMGYIQIFAGHTSLTRIFLEQAAPFIHHSEVGVFNCLAIRMMLINFLFHDGDFSNYFEQKHQLVSTFGADLVSQSIAGPFCYIWEMDIALNQGNFAVALEIADHALIQHPPFSPHLRSQILQLQGVALAMQGHMEQALAAAAESRQMRELAGGRYFITQNKLLVGLVFCHCGRHEQGINLLGEGIEDARRMPTEYLESCGLLHRAAVLLAAGQAVQARQDIEAGLRLLRRNNYRHFWAWTPKAMEALFSHAVRQGIEPQYVQALAAGRISQVLFDDGTTLPLLDIQTLGSFKILHQGVTLLEAEALTPLQRELLALLLAAPNLKVPQETILLHFWPDSPPDAVKIKFDTLVSRLRKTLAEVLPENTVHFYLNREKGMLWLAHCRLDAQGFLDGVKRGLTHYRLQEFWQAGNMFTAVEPLWQGEFVPGVAGDDRIRNFRDALVRSLSDLAFAWSELLTRANRLPAAIRVVEKALTYDQLNDRLYACLYRLEGRHSAIHSRRVLNRFEAVLHQEGYPQHEIADMITEITTP
ncbi:hypothetical protein [Desulfobulbus sp.]|uniref:hypothetical protein n=1 Tax=Desulfobulbus sp. TaxID=895 RepID=UPI0027BAA0F6|nr:hypothetical protein [Desulfobulbus sp.]